ncbi:MAG: glycoside hydrolase family 3 C-terminal domain-containing protein, partial [Phototrophicaceae bacterium]
GQHESVPDGEASQGDRTKIELLPVQENLLRQLHATGRPVVLVLVNGSAIAVNWADANLPAVLEAWYPGQAGGTAVADVLFGDYNPGGRLPVTFYRSTDDLPDFSDYSMEKRTYRYFRGEPLYPFGHGLSYTTFAYDNLRLSASHIEAGEPVEVRVDVTNTGDRAGDEVVQLYLADVVASTRVPQRSLAGFARLALEPGQSVTVTFTITPQQYAMIDAAGRRVIEPGAFDVFVGGGQPGFASGQGRRFEVTGEGYEL